MDDIENSKVDDVGIHQQSNTSTINTATNMAPKYQQEEIEKLLKLADGDLEEDNIGLNDKSRDITGIVSDTVQESNTEICDHATPSDHDMNYEMCSSKKVEPCISKQSKADHIESVFMNNGTKSDSGGGDKAVTRNDNCKIDDNKTKPIPAPRNLFLNSANNNYATNADSKPVIRERSKTYSFVQTYKIPPTPFRLVEIFRAL